MRDAAVSALILYTFPRPSLPTVEIMGMYPRSRTSAMGRVSISVISPTKPRRLSAAFARIIPASMPHRPMARPPLRVTRSTKLLFTFPASTICTISTVSRSVTRKPSTKLLFLPTRWSISVISGPPPCTSTTLMPIALRSTMSPITASFSSSLIIALPPYLITMVLSLYFWIYGSA